jgi:hypothetical protein
LSTRSGYRRSSKHTFVQGQFPGIPLAPPNLKAALASLSCLPVERRIRLSCSGEARSRPQGDITGKRCDLFGSEINQRLSNLKAALLLKAARQMGHRTMPPADAFRGLENMPPKELCRKRREQTSSGDPSLCSLIRIANSTEALCLNAEVRFRELLGGPSEHRSASRVRTVERSGHISNGANRPMED